MEALQNHCKVLQSITECCRALRKQYGTLRSVTRALRSRYRTPQKRYGTLRNITDYGTITERCRVLQNFTEASQKHYSVLWSVMEHCGTLRMYGTLRKRCGLLRKVTENIDFALHKLNFKFCSSLKCGHGLRGHARTGSEPDTKY